VASPSSQAALFGTGFTCRHQPGVFQPTWRAHSHSKIMTAQTTSASAQYPSLAGRTVFITGGGSGIGADLVRGFARQGARVGFIDIDAAASTQLVAELAGAPTPPRFLHVDVRDVAALQAAIADTAAALGDISVLINNVASDDRHELADVNADYFDQRVAINLRPHFFATQAVVDGMRRLGGGAIINLGSVGWKIKSTGYPVYALCKAAAQGLTRSLARELGPDGIRVNTLTPGWVMTPRQLARWVDADAERALDENQCLPGRVYGTDIAALALFLAADDSRMVTAQDFTVDAGWS
jgi:NAD(P)-dependent dehydrogenase (short-subunit alcohol dehydrogenase family)